MDYSLLNARDEAEASLLQKSFSEDEISISQHGDTTEDAKRTSYESDSSDTQAEVVDEWPPYDCIAGVNRTGGQYCCVPLCRSSSGQRLERERLGMVRLSFHSFPNVKTSKGMLWIAKICRDPGPSLRLTVILRFAHYILLLKTTLVVMLVFIQRDVC